MSPLEGTTAIPTLPILPLVRHTRATSVPFCWPVSCVNYNKEIEIQSVSTLKCVCKMRTGLFRSFRLSSNVPTLFSVHRRGYYVHIKMLNWYCCNTAGHTTRLPDSSWFPLHQTEPKWKDHSVIHDISLSLSTTIHPLTLTRLRPGTGLTDNLGNLRPACDNKWEVCSGNLHAPIWKGHHLKCKLCKGPYFGNFIGVLNKAQHCVANEIGADWLGLQDWH